MSSISYVNTDVQIQKIWGHSNNRKLLRQYLGDKSVLTSWYVLLEYKATVVLGFIRFYHHLKHQSFDDALAVVRAEFAVGYKNYILMAIQDLWQLGTEYRDKRLVLRRLETMIKVQLIRLFEQEIFVVQYVGDEVWRKPALTAPTTDLLLFTDSLNAERPERTVNFIRKNRKAFESLVAFSDEEKMRRHKKKNEFLAIVKLCAEIVANTPQISDRECNQLSDAVIAVDAPFEAEVCAFDSLFDLLCAALGKKEHTFPDLTPRIPRR
ncbi:hypothetical protein FJZ31_42700 [Candidatus Poribacteria bacterium]|nr:hypothetical protein [Candidatus Poribacteria bacterium]